jgi:hypothetical protein
MGKKGRNTNSGGGGGGGNKSSTSTSNTKDDFSNYNPATGKLDKNIPMATNSRPDNPVKPPPASNEKLSILAWCRREKKSLMWILLWFVVGGTFGFGIGSGILTGDWSQPPQPWRLALGKNIRNLRVYKLTIGKLPSYRKQQNNLPLRELEALKKAMNDQLRDELKVTNIEYLDEKEAKAAGAGGNNEGMFHTDEPSHPRVFDILREAIVRETGGYVHPDLGYMVPAPSGAARGLGMVRDTYQQCQSQCMPGVAAEKIAWANDTNAASNPNKFFKQEEVLVRVPLSYQMTRQVALDTLTPLIPAEVQRKASLHELDDAALLVLLLAHERGVGRYSRWNPYISSLPLIPSCGYSPRAEPHMLDAINAMRDELGVDVHGWEGQLQTATKHAEKIVAGLEKDYGQYLRRPYGITVTDNLHWALCQVASRATGGSQKHGSLRMIPLLDLVNHDVNAGGFVELTGKESLDKGDFVNATKEDSGAFVVRSLRHGRRKALKKGQELLVNYNIPHYSPLDWFVSLGFVPPERFGKWEKLDPALPKIRRDGPFAEDVVSSAKLFEGLSKEL